MSPASRRTSKRSTTEPNIIPIMSTESINEPSNTTEETTSLTSLINMQAAEISTNNERNFIFQQIIVKRAQPRENNYEQICIVPRE